MEQKIALVNQRLALLDSSSSSSGSDKDDEFEPGVRSCIECFHTSSDCCWISLSHKMLRPKEVYSEQRTIPAAPRTCNTQNTSNDLTKTTKVSVKGQNKYLSAEECCGSAMERAQEVQAKLPAEHPSFVKHMLQSHVVRGFWLGLPADFCNKHLPKHDTGIVLEDEDGTNHDTTYLSSKQGLSAGWRGFAVNHDIKVGDVVVFQLVRLTKFKVYILREKNFGTTDEALGFLSYDACKKRKISKVTDNAKPKEDPKTTRVSSKVEITDNAKSKEDPKPIRISSKVVRDDTQNLVSEAIDGIRFSDSEISFEDVASFSNFNIIVDSLVIDCKFLDHQRRTYYELCCSQKSFLHKHLLRQLNLKLVVGVIMETIIIAEGIRACKVNTSSHEDFLIWKKTLESFQLLGMNVVFLLKRVDDLLGLAAQPRDPSECDKYNEMKRERSRTGEKMKALESKMSTLKDALKKIDAEMEEMESSLRKYDTALQKIATAPW
uniref:TF-B3 domain-containing protein n=1 Tax=Oryza brachyantha TaxID=4533 RepID=J3KY14_ORYBR